MFLIDDSFTKEEVESQWYMRRDEKIKVDIPEGMKVVSSSELWMYEGWMVEGEFVANALSPNPFHAGWSKVKDASALWEGSTAQLLAEAERTIHPDILKVVIEDEQWDYYRIIPMEYKFLKKHGLPLPRKHWLARMRENFRV